MDEGQNLRVEWEIAGKGVRWSGFGVWFQGCEPERSSDTRGLEEGGEDRVGGAAMMWSAASREKKSTTKARRPRGAMPVNLGLM